MLSGDNSILTKAVEAKNKTGFAQVQEEIALAQAEAVGNQYLGGSSDTIEAQVLAKLTAEGYTIGSENSGTIQDISLSSNSVTIEEGGNTAEVTATLNTSGGSTNYVFINGLYYPLNKKANGDIELGETGKKTLENSTVTLSDVTLAPTGSINATIDSSTGKVTITSSNVTADENNDKVELKYNNTTYGTINVAVKKASITIPETADVTSGGTTTLTATLAEYQKGTVSWTITPASTYVSLTGSTTGTSVTVTGGTTTGQTATIRATYTTGTASVTTTADCVVTVKADNHIADKSYVDYNVAYTDVYTGTPYTSDTGWRLLTDLSSYESAGTYTGNIEIISTGIPAKLSYYYDTIKNFEYNSSSVTKGNWAGNLTQRTAYLDKDNGGFNYTNRSINDNNIYAASGLLYNFGNIVFSVTGTTSTLTTGSGNAFENDNTRNYGGFIEIKKNGSAISASGTTTAEDLFKANVASGSVTEIRSVTFKDIKGTNDDSNTTSITTSVDINRTNNADKRKGLFRLDQYDPDKHSSLDYYWLASPVGDDDVRVRGVESSGDMNVFGYNGYPYGVRPIVSISNVKLELHGNVWQIVAK